MSGHGDPHEEAHGDEHEHDEHDDDHHGPPPLEEPATPLWLTLLGVGLFLVAGILFIATREDGKTTAQLTAVPSAEGAAAPAPAAAPNPGNPAVRLNAPPNPPGSPGQPAAPGGVQQPAVRPRPAP